MSMTEWYVEEDGLFHWRVRRHDIDVTPTFSVEESAEWFWTRRGAQAHADFLNEEQAWADEVEREIYRRIDSERLEDIFGRNPQVIGDKVVLMRPRHAVVDKQLGCS